MLVFSHALILGSALTAERAHARPAPSDIFDLEYRIEIARTPQLAARMQLTLCAGSDTATTFEVTREWGGVDRGGDDITDVQASVGGGEPLAMTRIAPHQWRVRHAPGRILVVRWTVQPNTHQDDPSPPVNRRPILNEGLFHAPGELLMLRPSELDPRERRIVRLRWEGVEAAGWHAVSSFGAGAEPRIFEASLLELREAIYMAGDFEPRRRDVRGQSVWVALRGRDWSFTADDLADRVARIVQLERDFFDDHTEPYFLVTAIPVGQASAGSRSLGGTGLTHSFSIWMLPGTPLDGEFGRSLNMDGLLAHEMMHQWIGHTIAPEDPEERVYWFTEGFTDFYTRRLLRRGGLIGPEQFAAALNAKLAEFWASPAREVPNERIRTDFWRDRAVQRLPYLRGDAVALIADAAIRKSSGGARSLDDLLRDLVREARSTGERYSTEELLQRIATWSDQATAEQLRTVIVEGALPPLDAATFAPCATLRMEDLGSFELGFDYETARRDHRVAGLVPGSAAAVAGLRDGQELSSWSVHFGDATQPVVLKVEDETGAHEITYLPVGARVPTPQITPVVGAGEKAGPECGER